MFSLLTFSEEIKQKAKSKRNAQRKDQKRNGCEPFLKLSPRTRQYLRRGLGGYSVSFAVTHDYSTLITCFRLQRVCAANI
mmetsp:Transcript_1889/g.2174  ORF Transcript_1889/g.2174 Transcript_1889/m.2174 type:complete len:80 (-) Transcript_1889:136-375(-)